MTPTQVQHTKEGRWYPWVAGSVDRATLAMRTSSGEETAYVNGVVVHSLRFPNDCVWSVKGGWKK